MALDESKLAHFEQQKRDREASRQVVRQAEATARRPETRDWTLGFRAWKDR